MIRAIGFWVKKEVYEPDFQTYLNALTEPLSANQKTYINDFYVGVKTICNINLFHDICDLMYYFGNETSESGLKNMVQRYFDATLNNSPVFTQYEGFSGTATNMTISVPFNPITDEVNYRCKKNDNTIMGYWRILDDTTNNHHLWINSTSELGSTRMRYVTVGERYYNYNFHSYSNGFYIREQLGRPVGFISSRRSNTDQLAGHNKTYLSQSKDFAIQSNTFTLQTYLKQISFYMMGKWLSTEHLEGIMDQFEILMDKNGKGVL